MWPSSGRGRRHNIERSLAAVDIELDGADLAEIDHITMNRLEDQGASTPEGAL